MDLFRTRSQSHWRALLARTIAAAALVMTFSGAGIVPASAQTGNPPAFPPGVSRTTLRLKFHEGTVIPASGPVFPAQIAPWISKAQAQFGQGKARLDGLRKKGKQRTGRDLPDLSLWYTLTLKPGADAASIVQILQALPEVETVSGAALPAPPPVTDDFSGYQGYLGSMGATDAWAYDAAGAGENVTIYDLEYSWNTSHEDLTKAATALVLLDPGDYPEGDYVSEQDHGTAVLGEIIADDNGFGVTGIAHNAGIALGPVSTHNHDYDLAYAILLATLDASPGDVILIEQQTYVCNSYPMLGPSEWDPAVWDAIRTATDNGITVVEAAGNGHEFMWLGQNLDAKECQGWFKPTHDSGAIIVGAGQSDLNLQPRSRLEFSDYGKRVNVQAWGDSVMTTGYGNWYSNGGGDENADYTGNFSGTSSASPMVAGVVANMQSLAIGLRGEALSPEAIRAILISTGAPQTGNKNEHIGPQVRAGAAIAAIALARPSGPSASLFYTTGAASLKWGKLKGFGDEYLIRVDDDPGFLNPEFTGATKSTSIKTTALPFGDYFWQVAALDVDGGSFQVTALKSPRPGGSALTGLPVFKWAVIPGASEYTIEIDTDPGFGGPDKITGTPTGPTFTPPAPLALDNWYWRVRASAGTTTGFTPAWMLHRTLISAPAHGAATSDTTPKLTWKASPGTDEYEVKIDDDPALSSPDLVTTSATTVSPPLDFGRWFWDVRASSGITTPETPIFSFEVTALMSPKDGSVTLDTTPTFKWRAVPNAGTYQIIVGTGWDDVADQVLSPVIDTSGLTKTSYTPLTALTARTTYYWQVITTSGKTMPVWSFREP